MFIDLLIWLSIFSIVSWAVNVLLTPIMKNSQTQIVIGWIIAFFATCGYCAARK